MPFVLSLDEGTSSARAALYDRAGARIAMESDPIHCRYPQPGWVEQDAEDIWRSQLAAAKATIARAAIDIKEITAIGITNQRETTVVWDRRTGAPVGPAIVWQCRRTAERCAELARSSDAALIESRTGLVIDAYFSASKIAWILDHTPGVRERARNGELAFGNIDTWLLWKLTHGATHATDITNASRTMLMNLERGAWDDDLLRIFDVPKSLLPEIVPSSGVMAEAAADIFGRPIPIAGIAGDQQAALAGQACFRAGLAKNTYGTGCFALIHSGSRVPHSANRLLGTRAAGLGKEPAFAVEGSVFIAGAAIQWLRDQLGIIPNAAESEPVALSVAGNNGVYFVPAFTGLGAPHWNADARGLICGMTRDTNRAHLVRAALESIAYQTRELIDAMEADAGAPLEELRVDGGASANNFLMQFQADILGRRIVRPADIETTALGAAYLAGLATGFWSGYEELQSFWKADRVFEPAMKDADRKELFDGWRTAVARARK
ncbi:MAG TPA: glycerol kinase GlpK [Bryobacteraceae bacterium]|jgi:glycerol kinase